MFLNSHIPGAVVCAADKDSSHSGRSEDGAAAPAPGFWSIMVGGTVITGTSSVARLRESVAAA